MQGFRWKSWFVRNIRSARVHTLIALLLVVSVAAHAATNEGQKTSSDPSTNQTAKSFVVVLSAGMEASIVPDEEKFRKEPLLKQYDLASFEKACRRNITLALKANPKTEVKEVAFYKLYVRGLDGAAKPPILLKIGDFASVTVRKRQ